MGAIGKHEPRQREAAAITRGGERSEDLTQILELRGGALAHGAEGQRMPSVRLDPRDGLTERHVEGETCLRRENEPRAMIFIAAYSCCRAGCGGRSRFLDRREVGEAG